MCGPAKGGLANPYNIGYEGTKAIDPNAAQLGGELTNPAYYLTQPQTDPSGAAAAAAAAAQQAEIEKTVSSINAIFDSPKRQAQYKAYGQNTFDTLKNSLDFNNQTAQRQLKFGLSRSGNIGSSNDAYSHGLLQQDYDTGLLNASTQSRALKPSSRTRTTPPRTPWTAWRSPEATLRRRSRAQNKALRTTCSPRRGWWRRRPSTSYSAIWGRSTLVAR